MGPQTGFHAVKVLPIFRQRPPVLGYPKKISLGVRVNGFFSEAFTFRRPLQAMHNSRTGPVEHLAPPSSLRRKIDLFYLRSVESSGFQGGCG